MLGLSVVAALMLCATVHEIREMCSDRCRNITGYVSCKERCGDDSDCLQGCKDDFSDNVSDYRPYLNRRNN